MRCFIDRETELSSAMSNKAAICNASVAATRAEDKRKADVLRKSSLGELSIEDLCDLRAGKRKGPGQLVYLPEQTTAIWQRSTQA